MGRPIKKSNFGSTGIKVSFHNGTSVVTGYVVKQLGSRRFRVTDGTTTMVCSLAATLSAAQILTKGFCTIQVVSGQTTSYVKTLNSRHAITVTGERAIWAATGTTTLVKVGEGVNPLDSLTYLVDWRAGTASPAPGVDFTTANVANGGQLMKDYGNYTVTWGERLDGGVVQLQNAGIRRTDRGLVNYSFGSNIALWCRDLTNAAWAAANATVAKNQTGNIPTGTGSGTNTASSITATANGATVLQTIVNTSKVRAVSAWLKRLTGTGTVEMTVDGGLTWTVVVTTSNWARCKVPLQTLADPSIGFRLGTSGDSIAVDLVQCQTGFHGPPIVTTTAAVTTSDTRVSMQEPAGGSSPIIPIMKTGRFTFFAEMEFERSDAASAIFTSDGGFVCNLQTDGRIIVQVNGLNAYTDAGIPIYKDGRLNRIAGWVGDGQVVIAVNGTIKTIALATPVLTMTHNDVATQGSGGSSSRSYISKTGFAASRLTDQQYLALATAA